jgi:hypothetical protein
MSVGERIAIYRRRRGLSQLALANMIGRSEAWLSQVERGIRHVDRFGVGGRSWHGGRLRKGDGGGETGGASPVSSHLASALV